MVSTKLEKTPEILKKKNSKQFVPIDIAFMCGLFVLMPFLVVTDWVYEYSTQKHWSFTIFFTVMFIVYAFRKKELKIDFNIPHLFLGLFGIGAVLSLGSVLMNNKYYFETSLEPTLYILVVIFVSFLFTTRFGEKYDYIETALLFFLIAGTAIALDGLLNKFTGWDILFKNYGDPSKRIVLRTTIGNPNFVSDFLAQLIPISIYYALRKKTGLLMRVYAVLNVFLMYWVTLLAQTRIIFVAFFIGMAVAGFGILISRKNDDFITYVKSKKFIYSLLSVIAVIVFLLIMFNIDSPFNRKGEIIASERFSVSSAVTSWDERSLSWLGSIEQFTDKNNPENKLIGGGVYTYPVYFADYLIDIQKNNPQQYLYAWNNFKVTHNDYLEALGETGIIGFIGIIGILISLLIIYIRIFRINDDPEKLLLAAMLGWSVSITAIHSFTEFPLHLQPNLITALFMASMLATRQFHPVKEFHVKNSVYILLPVIVVCLFASYYKTRFTAAEIVWQSAQSDYEMMNYYEGYSNQLPVAVKQLDDQISQMQMQIKSYFPGSQQFAELSNQLAATQNKRDELNSQKKEIADKSYTAYINARNNFNLALDLNPGFGKAQFYLAQLFTKMRYRFKEMKYYDLEKIYNLELPEYRHMIKTFEGEMSLFPFPRKELRNTIASVHDPKAKEDIQSLLILIQAFYDEIDMLESSYVSFSEKNSYRLIAKLNYELITRFQMVKDGINKGYMNKKYLPEVDRLQKQAYNDFIHWYNQAYAILPGGWNRFPEWESIYSESLNLTAKLISIPGFKLDEITEKMCNIIEKDGWANYYMARKTSGIPDASLEIINSFQPAVESNPALKTKLIQTTMKAYKNVYDYYKADLENNKKKYENEKFKERVVNFVTIYESLK